MDQAAQGVVKLYVSHLYREAAGIVLVSTVVPGSPADALGVKVGSMVLAVGGQPTDGLDRTAVIERISSSARPLTLALRPLTSPESASKSVQTQTVTFGDSGIKLGLGLMDAVGLSQW